MVVMYVSRITTRLFANKSETVIISNFHVYI